MAQHRHTISEITSVRQSNLCQYGYLVLIPSASPHAWAARANNGCKQDGTSVAASSPISRYTCRRCFAGDKLKKDIRCWLSPPDPCVNYCGARERHHYGTALWFTQDDVFKKWKTSGSLLWIHGIRTRASFASGIPDNLLAASGKSILWYISPYC